MYTLTFKFIYFWTLLLNSMFYYLVHVVHRRRAIVQRTSAVFFHRVPTFGDHSPWKILSFN